MQAANPSYRQGDLLVTQIDARQVPREATVVPRDSHGRIVLALGESTGHAHALLEREVELLTTTTGDAAERWLRVAAPAGATLRHEEHAPLLLPAGVYRVIRQRQYEPEATRLVMD